jgi:hypothetical protein
MSTEINVTFTTRAAPEGGRKMVSLVGFPAEIGPVPIVE